MSRVRLSAAEMRLLRHLSETAPTHYWLKRYVKPQHLWFLSIRRALFMITSGVLALRTIDFSVMTDLFR